jgi:hypothetical protein
MRLGSSALFAAGCWQMRCRRDNLIGSDRLDAEGWTSLRLYGRRSNGAERLRRMYQGGRADATAKRYARVWAWVFRRGLAPRRWVALEVPGRTTGRITRFPLGMADHDGEWYLVSMLGDCNWVRNVRANADRAVLCHGRCREVILVELPVADRAPVIRSYLRKVPGGRPHIRVDVDAPLRDFDAIAATVPVFRIVPAGK